MDQERSTAKGPRTMSRTASQPRIVSTPSPGSEPEKPRETTRDFVEQIVVAIILAILIRGYDAEAFVIPTGSMAPTLMGRHKEVSCPECGLVYTINASEESEQLMAEKQAENRRRLEEIKAAPSRLAPAEAMRDRAIRMGDRAQADALTREYEKIRRDAEDNPKHIADLTRQIEELHEVGLCVNCRARTVVDDQPSFKGDRILVMKFPYEIPSLPGSAGPRRWDVVVFHYPVQPETNYIKRLVGLPGEELRINHGDLQSRAFGSNDPFVILRKPPIHRRAMQMLVYDDAHRPKALEGKPEWSRWNPKGWKEDQPGTFACFSAAESNWSELRYRHLLPDPEQWADLRKKAPLRRPARPTLITDFYSYNTNSNFGPYSNSVQASEGLAPVELGGGSHALGPDRPRRGPARAGWSSSS